jgi:ParB family transcriptional regulator, chromosome partitioning protein
MDKRPALGKGLSALIPDAPVPRVAPTEVDIDRLVPNAFQPRGQFDDGGLDDLARSIQANGIIQPIVVRKTGDRFQIIAGERRWRAAQKAGLLRVPVVVREVAPGQERSLLEMALIENIQREDLNPIDEALAYRRLADEFQLTQEAIATAVGKDRASVANFLRLLKLPAEVQADVALGGLSMGHARALLALGNESDQLRLSREVMARKLSVRETETLVRKMGEPAAAVKEPAEPPPTDVHSRAAEERLRLEFGTRVRIVRQGTRGRIEFDFGSEAELIRLFDRLMGED